MSHAKGKEGKGCCKIHWTILHFYIIVLGLLHRMFLLPPACPQHDLKTRNKTLVNPSSIYAWTNLIGCLSNGGFPLVDYFLIAPITPMYFLTDYNQIPINARTLQACGKAVEGMYYSRKLSILELWKYQ